MKYIASFFLVLMSLVLLIACGGNKNKSGSNSVSSEKALKSFSIEGTVGAINESNKTIAVNRPFGTDVTALIASFATTGVKVSIGSITQVSGSTANNFTNPVIYTITAADGSSVQYTVTVSIALNPAKAITSFSVEGTVGAINESGKTIAVNRPFGTDVTALIASFTTTGVKVSIGSITQLSGSTVNNFTNPAIYTVTAADGSSVQYTVMVRALNPAKAITSFSLNGMACTINEIDKTITANMTSATNVTKLIATFTTTGVRVNIDVNQQISGVTPNNFTYPVFYTVIAEDGTAVNYQVTALSQSLAYQINYAHSGQANLAGPISFPVNEAWSVAFDGPISYPLIAGGKVFVLVPVPKLDWYSGVDLYALDLATGGIIWGPVNVDPGPYQWAGFAYDRGNIFVMNHDARLTSYNTNTGRMNWTMSIQFDHVTSAVAFSKSTPVAVNGIIYVAGSGVGITLFAINELDGSVLWTRSPKSGDSGSPTAAYNGVFVSYPGYIYKFDPLTGNTLWGYWVSEGGGGRTSAYANGLLYSRDSVVEYGPGQAVSSKYGLLNFNAETGEIVYFQPLDLPSYLWHVTIPALTKQTKFMVLSGTLQAIDLNSNNIIWTFSGDGNLVSAPIVINGHVIVGSSSGLVYALDSSNGTQIWSANAGAPIIEQMENFDHFPLSGFGAGEGYMVVPASNVLTAWRVGP